LPWAVDRGGVDGSEVIRMMRTDGLRTLKREVMMELEARLAHVEEQRRVTKGQD
jgi:hypothetical protein